MTSVLKSGSEACRDAVGPLARPQPRESAIERELERLRGSVDSLQAELSERDAAVARLSEEAAAAYDRGEADGRETGRKEAADRGDAALNLIAEARDKAVARFETDLKAMERLAALLARTCLDRMFGTSKGRDRIVTDLIRHQVGRIEADAIIRIEVSAEDFPNGAAIEDAAAAARAPACAIEASARLGPGECTIRLALGAIEIGVDQQWGALRDTLDTLAEGAAG